MKRVKFREVAVGQVFFEVDSAGTVSYLKLSLERAQIVVDGELVDFCLNDNVLIET